MEKFIAWILAFMTTLAPAGRPQYIPDAVETREDAMVRYQSIATDLAEVLSDENEVVITRGDQARLRMASIMLSVMLHESGFRKDVDFGVGKYARGDNGRSWCLMQMNVGTGKTRAWNIVTHRFAEANDPADQVVSWTGPELVADRKNCIRAGLHTLVGVACRGLPVNDWLRAYASGSCEKGGDASKARMATAMSWFSSHRPTFNDLDLKVKTPLEVAVSDLLASPN